MITLLVLTGVAGMLGSLTLHLYRGRLISHPGPDSRRAARRTALGVLTVLLGWLAATFLLGEHGVWRQDPDEPVPWIGIGIVGVLITGLLGAQLPAVAAAIDDPAAAARLTQPQTFRAVGLVFFILWLTGDLPAVFAWPAAAGDIAIGIAAPFVATRLQRHPQRRTGATWFHALGILDLVIAVGTGFLAAPGPLRLFDTDPSSGLLSVPPLVLVPTLLVPLSITLHILALRRLPKPPAAPALTMPGPARRAEAPAGQ